MKKYLPHYLILLILVSLVIISSVSAATTISTSISTGGDLAVTGTSTILGNLGIGTTTPSTRFHLTTNSDLILRNQIQNTTATGYAEFWMKSDIADGRMGIDGSAPQFGGGTLMYMGTYSNYPLAIYSNSIERMRLTETGRLGIGTASPTARLSVTGSSTSATDLGFVVANSSGTGLLNVMNGGSVGIGTSTPSVPLQVTTPSSNATTSMEIGKALQTKGSCLVMYDEAGTVQYLSIRSGALVVSSTSCK